MSNVKTSQGLVLFGEQEIEREVRVEWILDTGSKGSWVEPRQEPYPVLLKIEIFHPVLKRFVDDKRYRSFIDKELVQIENVCMYDN